MSIEIVSSLDWPSDEAITAVSIQCAGEGFLDYYSRKLKHRSFHHGSSFHEGASSSEENGEEDDSEVQLENQLDLLSISPEELEALTYYQVLGGVPMHASTEQVKRAYHKACLSYHPDKTGRGEEDEVFLKVKGAFDVLSDPSKRRAYDSSIDFDDAIPKGGETSSEFYSVYRPVFERNLRFDARNDPQRQQGKKQQKRRSSQLEAPPTIGDDDTPLEDVHAFYDYWIHFDSWRDFTLVAQEQHKDGHNMDVDNAESRYEKRWIQKELDKKAKALKKQEMVRITTLVERAMAADPRLKKQRQLEKENKERLERERLQKEDEERIRAELKAAEAAKCLAEQEAKEQEARALAKAQKEREKKQLRKARQALRKRSEDAFQKQNKYKTAEELHNDVELLCTELSLVEITQLTKNENGSFLSAIQSLASATRGELAQAAKKEHQEKLERRASALKEEEKAKAARRNANPWTKDELSALAKAVKKYPAGGANRWETIALFVNNLCRPEVPRNKEECIEKYNQVANQKPKQEKAPSTSEAPAAPLVWTDEQDKQLQQGLAKYPASMDKNERWTSIAKGVDGKGKKECVQRFKAIRQAIKKK